MKPCIHSRLHALLIAAQPRTLQLRFSLLVPGFLFLLVASPCFAKMELPSIATKNVSTTSGVPAAVERLRTNLLLLQDNNSTVLADGVMIDYNQIYHDSVRQEDARKFVNVKENIALLRHGSLLSVERRPVIALADTVYLKLWKTTKRRYQLEFISTNLDKPGLVGFLEDAYLNTSTPINLNGLTRLAFQVTDDAGSADTCRFKVVFKNTFSARPLPVNFVSLTGYGVKNQLFVEWKVADEINVARYEVERAADGIHFTILTTIQSTLATGNQNSYSVKDAAPVAGNNYYRIRSIDLDGASKHSGIVKITNNTGGTATMTLYPNPVTGNQVNLQFSNHAIGNSQLRLMSSTGQLVYQTAFRVTHPNFTQTVVPNQTLKPGIYQLEIRSADNKTFVQQVMVR